MATESTEEKVEEKPKTKLVQTRHVMGEVAGIVFYTAAIAVSSMFAYRYVTEGPNKN